MIDSRGKQSNRQCIRRSKFGHCQWNWWSWFRQKMGFTISNTRCCCCCWPRSRSWRFISNWWFFFWTLLIKSKWLEKTRFKHSINEFIDNHSFLYIGLISDDATVRVTNLPEETQEQDLRDLFVPFGAVTRVFLAKDKTSNTSKGFAFITFAEKKDAQKAIECVSGYGYYHLILKVEWAK